MRKHRDDKRQRKNTFKKGGKEKATRKHRETKKKSGFGKNKRKKKEAKKTLCKKENVEKVFWCGNSEETKKKKGSVKMR